MSLPVLGIDIAKESYTVALLVEAHCYQHEFPNRPSSFKSLSTWLQKRGVARVHACLEATGRYGENLAEYLHQHGHTVSVVNPMRIKAYMQSQLARNKTDQLDAELIARFCQTQNPPPWIPPAPEIRELQELLHQYTAVQDDRQREANRLQAGLKAQTVQELIQAHLDFLDQQIEKIKRLIQEHIDRYPHLKAQSELLTSIPGIGDLTAAHLVAVEMHRFADARALTAYGGLNPMVRTSGKSVRRKPRLSKIGHATLRKALYLPALTAIRCNPIIQAFCARLAERGLCAMAIIGAAMRKLLCLAYGVLKSGRPFDPNYSLTREFAS
ncbi:MAG: IS110 family transposase [Chloroflexi bacterium]|nr:IS110 family transposase [Chloroflexota bacterium]